MSSPSRRPARTFTRPVAAELAASVRAVRPGGARLLVIAGPPGAGRSSVLRDALEALPGWSGVHVTALPWHAGDAGSLLARVVAAVGAAAESADARDDAPRPAPSPAAFGEDVAGRAAALAAAVDVAGAATAIAVDDAHFGDAESLRALIDVVRGCTRGRLAVIAACSDGGDLAEPAAVDDDPSDSATPADPAAADAPAAPSAPAAAADRAGRLLRTSADDVVTLSPLDVAETRALALATVGARLDATAAERLRDLSGGRPGPVREILESVPGDHWRRRNPGIPVPRGWIAAMQARLAEAPEGVGAVLRAVATFDEPADVRLVRSLLDDGGAAGGNAADGGSPGADVGAAIDAAVDLGFLRTLSGDGSLRLEPAGPSDRAVLRATTPPGERARLHLGAAAWFRAAGDGSAALAHEARAANGPDDALARRLSEEGRALGDAGRWRGAAEQHRLAAALSGDGAEGDARRLDAIDALIAAADIPEARLHARALPPLPSGGGDPHRDLVLGYLALHEGRRTDAELLIGRASPEPGAGPGAEPAASSSPGPLAARAATRRVLLALADWDPEGVVTWADRARAWSEPGSAEHLEAEAIAVIGRSALAGGAPEDVPVPGERPLQAQRRHMALGWLALVNDDPIRARQLLRRRTQDEGSERIALWQDAWLARSHFVMGDWDAAASVAERGLARADRFGIRMLEPLLLWTAATIAAYQGDMALAASYVARLAPAPDAFAIQRIPSAMARMLIAALAGDPAAATRAGDELDAYQRVHDFGHAGFWPWDDVYAQQLLRAGRVDDAREAVDRAADRLDAARRSGAGVASAEAKLAVPRAHLLLHDGDVEGGIALLDDAVDAISALPMPAYRSRILFEYGQLLRRLGRRRLADDMFARAGEVFAAMGATRFVERCNQERRVGGLGTRDVGSGGLTPQEEEIAALVAEGATNREVSGELFLSPKTVEYHLTRVYRKLRIRSRGELARALREASRA